MGKDIIVGFRILQVVVFVDLVVRVGASESQV